MKDGIYIWTLIVVSVLWLSTWRTMSKSDYTEGISDVWTVAGEFPVDRPVRAEGYLTEVLGTLYITNRVLTVEEIIDLEKERHLAEILSQGMWIQVDPSPLKDVSLPGMQVRARLTGVYASARPTPGGVSFYGWIRDLNSIEILDRIPVQPPESVDSATYRAAQGLDPFGE